MSDVKKHPKKNKGQAEKDTIDYSALRFAQRDDKASLIVIFHASAKDVLKWSSVGVLTPSTKGHQRAKREAKVNAITKFLKASKNNIIPTAVIVAFTKGAATFLPNKDDPQEGIGVLTIKADKSAANVVDGQHRLYGMEQFKPSTQVAIVGLLEANDVEKAFQFLVINNKSSRVPATHAKAVLASMKNTNLAERLSGARLAFDAEGIRDVDILNSDKESPFYKCIDWSITDQKSRMVQATAVEASLAYLGNLLVAELEDRDVRRSVFATIWTTVKETWPKLWKDDSRLISKVGVMCLTRFIMDTITTWADSDRLEIDILDLDQLEELTKDILKYMDERFWTYPWASGASGGFDTNQGRERVVQALTQLYRNGKRGLTWSTDIAIIESTKN